MALYFISLDLRQDEEAYSRLYDELHKNNAVRMLEYQWCFMEGNSSAPQLRDHFRQFVHPGDSLTVLEISDWATHTSANSEKRGKQQSRPKSVKSEKV